MTTTHKDLICTCCKSIIDRGEEYKEHDGQIYCDDCFHAEFAPCSYCQKIMHCADLLPLNNGDLVLCSDCAKEHNNKAEQ